jgi:2,3-bisphosphoglycerate-independent phosphoglycerate mutase
LNFFNKESRKVHALIVLDGWGIAPVWGGNAIAVAETPVFNSLVNKYPSTTLVASGTGVGLSEGSPGNSEAGHLNIGAGQVILQDQGLIDNHINDGSFFSNGTILGAIEHSRKNNSMLHIMGLLSKTGTHSQIAHLYAILKLLHDQNFSNFMIHFFTDGRDSDVMSGIEMLAEVQNKCAEFGFGPNRIASIVGRFYAMDRDNNWSRVKKSYDLLTQAVGTQFETPGSVFASSYSQNITDEFIEPSVIANKSQPIATVKDNDSIILFNFRADRAKEITDAFLNDQIPDYPDRKKLNNLYFVSFVMYNENSLAKQAFAPVLHNHGLAQIWSEHGLKQYHSAESEKYAHVTYFFDGGSEKKSPGEDWAMIPSKKGLSYAKLPEMSARELTAETLSVINKDIYDCFVINFANPDMVGHTGDLQATAKAVSYVDQCLGEILSLIQKKNGVAFICADHGNAEQMVNPKTGGPDTEHTSNPVPFIIFGADFENKKIALRQDGKLSDIAPTVLELMGINLEIPGMNKSLIVRG